MRRAILRAGVLLLLVGAAAPGLSAQVWNQVGSLGAPWRPAFAVLLNNGQVLIGGGAISLSGPASSATTQAVLFSPATGAVSSTGSLVEPGSGDAAVTLQDGRVLVVGGACQGCAVAAPTPEIYDPTTGQFSVLQSVSGSPLPAPGFFYYPSATLLKDGEVLITGGPSESGGPFVINGSLCAAWRFDPKTNTFSSAGWMLDDSNAGGSPTQILLPDGDVLVVGGTKNDGSTSPDAPPQIYHVATNTWQTIPVTGFPVGPTVSDPGLANLPDGNVLIAGGGICCENGVWAWTFDASTDTVTAAKNPPLYDSGAPAFTLPSGKVFLPEGMSELYDPATASFGQAGLPPADAFHSMVGLPDGTILSAGGEDDATGGYLSGIYEFHDTPNPFTLSAPAGANFASGFGSVPIAVTVQPGFTAPITLSCRIPLVGSCSFPANPITSSQTVTMNLGMITDLQPTIITARSGLFSYWAIILLNGPPLAIGAAPASQTIKSGGSAQYQISLGSLDSFPAQLGCAHLPADAVCQFSVSPVVVDGTGARESTLTITTTEPAVSGGQAKARPTGSRPAGPPVPLLVAIFGLLFAAGLFYRGPGRRRVRLAALALVLAAALSCGGRPAATGGGKPPPPPPPPAQTTLPGNYTITVTAAYDPGAPLQSFNAATTVELTVQ